jgi:FkbM family methyltransferase
MTRVLRKVARSIRHLPGLKNLDGLWDRLRGPYETILNRGGEGVEVDIGGAARVRIPAAFANKPWEKYEPETMKVFVEWCKKNPGARILDVGSSVGLFTLASLFAHPKNEIVAFDSDLASLNILKEFCQLAEGQRIRLVRGLVSAQGCGRRLEEAIRDTAEELKKLPPAKSNSSSQYICLNDASAEGIRHHALDDLLQGWKDDGRPVLLKTDVEGAEQLVLEGARKWIQKIRPTLFLEVHPKFLPRFGHSTDSLAYLVKELEYTHHLIAIDYSEHWICEPNPRPSSKKS